MKAAVVGILLNSCSRRKREGENSKDLHLSPGVCLEGRTTGALTSCRRRVGMVNGGRNAEAGAKLFQAVRLVAITATQFMAASQALQ